MDWQSAQVAWEDSYVGSPRLEEVSGQSSADLLTLCTGIPLCTMHWGTALCYISTVQATLFYTGMQILPKLKGTLDEDTTADTLTGDLEDQESI